MDGDHGLMAYLKQLLAEKGHCVICVAEGAGQVCSPILIPTHPYLSIPRPSNSHTLAAPHVTGSQQILQMNMHTYVQLSDKVCTFTFNLSAAGSSELSSQQRHIFHKPFPPDPLPQIVTHCLDSKDRLQLPWRRRF